MTSKQAMLAMMLALTLGMWSVGCGEYRGAGRSGGTAAPYPKRQVWAVAPLNNESGSRYADGVAMADQVARRLTAIGGIDALPVNRVLAAMQAAGIEAVTSREQALALRQSLGVDGLLVGSLTAWDPYDPPKIGLTLDLYLDPDHHSRAIDARGLTWAATEDQALPHRRYQVQDQPVSTVAALYDAADPVTRRHLENYGSDRGKADGTDHHRARLYRISMDLYSEFVSRMVCSRLLDAERARMTPPPPAPDSQTDPRLTQAAP